MMKTDSKDFKFYLPFINTDMPKFSIFLNLFRITLHNFIINVINIFKLLPLIKIVSFIDIK